MNTSLNSSSLRTLTTLTALLFLFGSLTSGCVQQPREPLRVGVLLWPPYELSFLARERGFLDEERIRLVEYASPAVAVQDYRSGVLDAVTLTLNYALDIAQSADGQRIVLTIDESRGGDMVIARPEIESIGDLRGRSVGMEVSALGAYVLARALDLHGVEVSELDIVPVDLGEQVEKFVAGEIDAVTTYEPFAEELRQRGGKALFDSAALEGEIIDVLLTREGILEDRSAEVQHLVTAWLRAEQLFRKEPDASVEVMAARERLDPQRFAELLASSARLHGTRENLALLGGEQPGIMTVLEEVYRNSVRYGLLEEGIDIDALVVGDYVEQANRELGS